jgi:hypothetical protein
MLQCCLQQPPASLVWKFVPHVRTLGLNKTKEELLSWHTPRLPSYDSSLLLLLLPPPQYQIIGCCSCAAAAVVTTHRYCCKACQVEHYKWHKALCRGKAKPPAGAGAAGAGTVAGQH